MTAKLEELINELSLLSTTKEASAKTTPQDDLVSVLQGISASLTKKAEEEDATVGVASEEPEEGTKADASEDAAEAAGAIVKNPEPIAAAVASAVANVMKKEEKPEGEGEEMNEELIQKISSAVAVAVKTAVEGDKAFGVAADASEGNPAGAGNVQNMAKKILDAKTTQQTVTDPQMVAPGGAVDPMIGVAPQPQGGEQKPLQGNDIKAAMANLSAEDAEMIFKLASIGYDVSVETLAEELAQEKIAQAQYAQKVAQAQYAQKVAAAQQAQLAGYTQAFNPYGYNPYGYNPYY